MMRNDSARVSLREMTETILADPRLAPDRNQVARSSRGNYTLYVSRYYTIYFQEHSLSYIRVRARTANTYGKGRYIIFYKSVFLFSLVSLHFKMIQQS
jgi:hypothetical protein